MKVAIVGAGMAGLACGQLLSSRGCAVALFDKGRAAGGRMSTRRVTAPCGPLAFDHGAQFMTARDPAFRAELAGWRESGLAEPWPAAGASAWVGVPAMSAPLEAMSRGLSVRWHARVDALIPGTDGWRLRGDGLDVGGFAVVLTALPAEQTAILLREAAPEIAAVAAATPSEPCWTAMAAFAGRLSCPEDVLRPGGAVAWAARNAAKPGRGGIETWVIHASAAWSRDNLERGAEDVARDLFAGFFDLTGAPPAAPVFLSGHRWRYAMSGTAGRDTLWDPGLGIGACGDWLSGPRVENAWLSGRRLASLVAPQHRAGGKR